MLNLCVRVGPEFLSCVLGLQTLTSAGGFYGINSRVEHAPRRGRRLADSLKKPTSWCTSLNGLQCSVGQIWCCMGCWSGHKRITDLTCLAL